MHLKQHRNIIKVLLPNKETGNGIRYFKNLTHNGTNALRIKYIKN